MACSNLFTSNIITMLIITSLQQKVAPAVCYDCCCQLAPCKVLQLLLSSILPELQHAEAAATRTITCQCSQHTKEGNAHIWQLHAWMHCHVAHEACNMWRRLRRFIVEPQGRPDPEHRGKRLKQRCQVVNGCSRSARLARSVGSLPS